MDDQKKKKKNRKKKNKQRAKATTEDTASNAGDTSSSEQSQVFEPKKHLSRFVEYNGDVRDKGSIKIVESKSDRKAQGFINDTSSFQSASSDIGKQNWLQEESELEMKIKQLLCENDSWNQKEMALEQKISQLLMEKASLSSKDRDFQERVRHARKEKVVSVEKEVVELKEAKNNISQQNRELINHISTLQSRIQVLERSLASALLSVDAPKEVSEKEALTAQIEASCALVEKLVTQNAELVEKVNELYMELGRHNVMADVASVVIPDYVTVHDPISESGEEISPSAKRFEKVKIRDEELLRDEMESDYVHVAWHPSGMAVSGEIVQIPLHENEAREMEAQAFINHGHETVPFIDAPLMGAPLRLISFVARYVSGADLVNNNPSDSQQ